MARCWLYVPGNSLKMLRNATLYGVDGLVPDLEDSVPRDQKDESRILLGKILSETDYGEAILAVRINGLESPWWRDDLESLTGLFSAGKVRLLRVPKVEGPETIREVGGYLEGLEKRAGLEPGSLGIQGILETPSGVEQAFAAAAASPRVRALCFGAEDYCASLGLDRYGEEYILDYPRSRIACAAAAAGIPAYDTVWGAYQDEEGLKRDALRGRSLGFSGKSVIHPSQIETVREIFSPTEKELLWAQRVLTAAEKSHEGSLGVDGIMVDKPVIARAKRILQERPE